jgi:FemAB-related protein (PEP-CTERM system-associated)
MAARTGRVSLRIERFQQSPAEWNDFVSTTAGATHCHRHEWLAVIQDALGHEPIALVARDDDGCLAGVLPLIRVRSLLFGHYLVSMPFLNDGGPIGSPEAVIALAAEARRLADAGRVKLLELRSRDALPLDLRVSRRKVTVLLDLEPDPAALFSKLSSKLRSQVRRPQREGVEVRFGTDQIDPFYQVFARHMRDLGTPVLPRRFFHLAAAQHGAQAWFAAAWLADRPIAGGAGLRFGGEFEITWASSLREHNAISPNMGLYWAFLERACLEGCVVFNFGRCNPDSGTHRFKRQWGGRDVQLHWYQHGPAALTPSPDQGGLVGLGPRLWRHLPLPVATALGPSIVRGIP